MKLRVFWALARVRFFVAMRKVRMGKAKQKGIADMTDRFSIVLVSSAMIGGLVGHTIEAGYTVSLFLGGLVLAAVSVILRED